MATEPVLQIPEEQLPHLATLARLEDTTFKILADALAAAPLKFRSSQLALEAAARTPDSPELTSDLVKVLRELALVRAMAEVDAQQFVEDVVDGVTAQLKKGFPQTQRESLRRRLTQVLEIPSITAPAKAHSLLVDHANYLCRARVFTDVRPIFGADVAQTPITAIVVHTLKLSFHQGSSIRDFFVVLDGSDLDSLSELLDRAKAKEKTLHVTMAAAGIEPLTTR